MGLFGEGAVEVAGTITVESGLALTRMWQPLGYRPLVKETLINSVAGTPTPTATTSLMSRPATPPVFTTCMLVLPPP